MRTKSVNPMQIYNHLKAAAPASRADLKNYVHAFLGFDIPDIKLCPDHSTPMDYLWHSYNCDFDKSLANGDCIVWAGRGGGKTLIAAIATLLDCLFKPNCQIRILAGSEAQAGRLYDYLLKFVHLGFEHFLASPARTSRCEFINGSVVEVLTASPTSVRGSHIHKLRCDEIELFSPQIYDAAKFVTQSTDGLLGALTAISTMHKPFGLMHNAIAQAQKANTPIFKWCIWEVIEKCTDRSCSSCKLNQYCQSRAKNAQGYLKIDDCITQMSRASRAGFESEVLCKRPSLANAVFDEFDPAVHVAPTDYNPDLPLYRAMDFGFVNPFVCLWIQVDGDGVIRIIDEYLKSRKTIAAHAEYVKSKTPCDEYAVTASFCDPAGAGRNDVTGTSPVTVLRSLGIAVRYRKSAIVDGLELIRRALRSGDGKSNMIISPRCGKLIEALTCYHYPEDGTVEDELPEKDGVFDHPIDALRYFLINYTTANGAKNIRY